MQEATVAVPLLRPDQSAPRSGGPVGRLRRLLNGIVKKHGNDGRIKVEKRNGFHALSRAAAQVTTGAGLGNVGVPGTTLMGTLGDELVQIGNSVPYVYAPSRPAYQKFGDELVMTETAQRHVVRAGTRSAIRADAARVGNIACYTWVEDGGPWAEFVDLETDTPIRLPFQTGASGRTKVVSDGARFWIFTEDDPTVYVTAYGTDGVQQDQEAITTIPSPGFTPAPWDVTAMPGTGNGVAIAHNASFGVDYVRLAFATWNGTGITVTGPVFDDRLPATYGVSFLRNDFDPNHLYLATTSQFTYVPPGPDPSRSPGVYVGRLNLNGTHDALYVVQNGMAAADARAISNLTGYLSALNNVVYVSWTSFDRGAVPPARRMNSTITTRFADPEPGVSAAVGVKRSVSLAGRVFKLGTRYVMPCYYASVSQEGIVGTGQAIPVAQPTYFLVDVATQKQVGEIELGNASMDWAADDWDPTTVYGQGFFWLPSSFEDADATVHWTAGFVADRQTVQYDTGLGVFNYVKPLSGILDIRLGGRGVPIELGNEMLLPGPRAVSFSRDAFETAGIELAPESPSVTAVVDGDGQFEPGEQHRYAIVWSTINSRGDRIRSIASITTNAVTMTGSNNACQLVIPTLRMTTHETILIEIYRDVWDAANNVASNQLRRITVDEATPGDEREPVYNNPVADTVTWVDTVSNAACAIGAPIYVDDGTLDYFPCPAFSTGCVFADRVFVGGYDNRVYYSFSKVPGQALAFNADEFFFTVPTNQRVTALVPIDNRLFIFCDRSIWYVDGGNFLSADGTIGSNPTPIELQFKDGCTGRAIATSAGVVYHSSAGGLWLLTRGLEKVYIGAPVEDETADADVLDIAIDKDQRIGVLIGDKVVVYDQVVGVWSPWALPVDGVALCTWQGKLTWADNEATQRTYQQTDDAYDDNGGVIQTRIDLADIATADINGFQVIWETSALGEWKGAHTFNVDCTYDGTTDVDETFSETFATLVEPFRFDWQPRNIECSAIGLSVYDTFPGNVPSQGFTLEGLGLYVGIERGAKYQERRIAPAG